ncbi:MFS transporter [Lacisediminihabitans profunda]|uniref:MFS transporter n=1 Tax=Lacisediminihabitans profunda TaxID=2594790 RepID=A0A5C8UR63_9MICO|nr:MFS transporter [Lacisediminihabitans profunda]TXN31015.1 MFS transporter [Lacisediminihabitans profunda]
MVSRKGLGGAFSNLFTANLASSLGDGIARTAAPLLAARLTHDPVLIAGVAALSLLPWLLFAIPSGILIDRIDRRRALALANTVRTVLAVALAVLAGTGTLTIWWLYLVIFVYGTFETLYDGAIRAVVPSIVGRADLARANSRIEAGELVVQNLLSGPFTSALFAVSVLIPLGTNALVFAVAVVLAFLLPKAASGRQFSATHDEPAVAWYRQFVDGFRFITANRMLCTLWFFSTFIGICVSAATASFVLYLLGPLGLPEALYGVFLLTGAAGGVLGAALASRLGSWLGAGLAMAIATLLDALALLFAGVVPVLWAVGLGFFVSTFAVTVWNILVMSLRQSIIPGRLLGRVHGTWRTLLWGSMPVGSIIGGLIGRVDLALPFTIGGAASALAAVVFFRFLMSLPNPENVDNGDRIEAAPTEGLLLD